MLARGRESPRQPFGIVRRRYVVHRMYHVKLGGRTGEGANQGLPFHLIASFSMEESSGVLERCCCRLRWVSASFGYCMRSSLIEPGWEANRLIYPRLMSRRELRCCTVFATPTGVLTQNAA